MRDGGERAAAGEAYRSTRTGSTLAAGRAGTRQATTATARINSGTTLWLTRS